MTNSNWQAKGNTKNFTNYTQLKMTTARTRRRHIYTIAWRHMTRGVENNSGYWNLSLSRKIPTCVRHLSVRQDDIKTINFDMKFHSKEFKDVGTRSSTSVILLTALTSDATSYSAVAVQISIVTVATLKNHDIHWLRTFAYVSIHVARHTYMYCSCLLTPWSLFELVWRRWNQDWSMSNRVTNRQL